MAPIKQVINEPFTAYHLKVRCDVIVKKNDLWDMMARGLIDWHCDASGNVKTYTVPKKYEGGAAARRVAMWVQEKWQGKKLTYYELVRTDDDGNPVDHSNTIAEELQLLDANYRLGDDEEEAAF